MINTTTMLTKTLFTKTMLNMGDIPYKNITF
jgi:hypothetical protein